MAVTVAAHAHMMTDLAAEASAATATPGSLAATWSLSGRAAAARMVGTAAAVAEITTGPETTTTPGSAASTAATKTPGSCDATNKTGPCLVVGITFFTVVFLVSLIRPVPTMRVSRPAKTSTRRQPKERQFLASSQQMPSSRRRTGKVTSLHPLEQGRAYHFRRLLNHTEPTTQTARNFLAVQRKPSKPKKPSQPCNGRNCYNAFVPRVRTKSSREGNHSSSCIYLLLDACNKTEQGSGVLGNNRFAKMRTT